MRVSRWCYLTAAVALAAAIVAPASASALLTNEWNQKFAGVAVCAGCHGTDYNQTSHGQFAQTGESMTPAASSDMWPISFNNGATVTSDEVIALGAGTGLYEYLKFGEGTSANGPFGVFTGWDPAAPEIWEIDGATGVEFEDYACNQCHMLGAVKKGVTPPLVGNFAAGGAFNRVAGSANTWALAAGADPAVFESYLPGAGIQCERCHGTGVAGSTGGGVDHWGSGVQIVGFNTPAMRANSKASSYKVLDSQACGQCHGTFKSGNIAGFTPDQNINGFVTSYALSDVPGTKFFPNGQNKALKHSYYTEWAISGHSVRGSYSATATDSSGLALTTPYQASGASHYSSAGSSRVLCNRCHTGEGYLKRKGATIMDNWEEGVDTAGKYGQECVACHISHGPVGADSNAEGAAINEAVGMAVRAPEQADGDFSTAGLDVDNQSICEDCHNWQAEVMSADPVLPAVSLSPSTGNMSLGKYVSHPQREVYHGRSMVEVAEAGDFMPGAKCEQCHMPATKADVPTVGARRYDNRSFKRYSHRMFIMQPGDAESWGLAPWGDSCSPCHAGETQGALQANLDDWQSTGAELATDASAAIKAALVRLPKTNGIPTSAAEYDLLKRAAANVSIFYQDSSGGAHNPPYEQAGLAKALQLAESAGGTLSMSAPANVVSGALFGVMGTALNGDGTEADDVRITLYKNGAYFEEIQTNHNGSYFFTLAQTAGATYSVVWERSSQSASDLAASATIGMEVLQPAKTNTDVSLSINRQSQHKGRSFYLSGNLGLNVAGAAISIDVRGSGGWTHVADLTTSASGAYSWKTHLHKTGTKTYRAKFIGDALRNPSSAQHKIKIIR